MSKSIQLHDGDGFKIPKEGGIVRFACCDCGLVHDFRIAVEEDGDIGFVIERNNRSTGQIRRWKKDEIKIQDQNLDGKERIF